MNRNISYVFIAIFRVYSFRLWSGVYKKSKPFHQHVCNEIYESPKLNKFYDEKTTMNFDVKNREICFQITTFFIVISHIVFFVAQFQFKCIMLFIRVFVCVFARSFNFKINIRIQSERDRCHTSIISSICAFAYVC